jgi:hypothetical protein
MAIEQDIKRELSRVKQSISAGDESEIWVWVKRNRLACAQRPLRYHTAFGGRDPLPAEARTFVVDWVDRIVNAEFASVISC